jgi:hypothetical protein
MKGTLMVAALVAAIFGLLAGSANAAPRSNGHAVEVKTVVAAKSIMAIDNIGATNTSGAPLKAAVFQAFANAASTTAPQTREIPAAAHRSAAEAAPEAAKHSTEVSGSYWWGTQTWYSRSDVRAYASWWGVISIANRVCAWAGRLQGVCNATVNAYTGWIYNTWMYAKNTNQCLTMKMTWTGQVIGINAYGCNWG